MKRTTTIYIEQELYETARLKAIEIGHKSFTNLVEQLLYSFLERKKKKTIEDIQKEKKTLETKYMIELSVLENQEKDLIAKQNKEEEEESRKKVEELIMQRDMEERKRLF